MEKEKLYDKWTATGLETIKACVEDKIANYCELNKKQCQEVLNLIEKQQKEIQNLQTIDKEHQKLNGELREEIKRQGNTREIEEKYIEENFISKDKIRNKIEELENVSYAECIESAKEDIKLLQELLEEE